MGDTRAEVPLVESRPHIGWLTNADEGRRLASEQGKPVMIDFMATWCPPCRQMEDSTFSDPRVVTKAKAFVAVRIDVDQQGKVADAYGCNAGKYGGIGIPNILFLDPRGQAVKHPIGFTGPDALLAIMDSVLSPARP